MVLAQQRESLATYWLGNRNSRVARSVLYRGSTVLGLSVVAGMASPEEASVCDDDGS